MEVESSKRGFGPPGSGLGLEVRIAVLVHQSKDPIIARDVSPGFPLPGFPGVPHFQGIHTTMWVCCER